MTWDIPPSSFTSALNPAKAALGEALWISLKLPAVPSQRFLIQRGGRHDIIETVLVKRHANARSPVLGNRRRCRDARVARVRSCADGPARSPGKGCGPRARRSRLALGSVGLLSGKRAQVCRVGGMGRQ